MTLTLPHTLVAGTAENVNNVQANLEAIRDYVNTLSGGVPTVSPDNNAVYRHVARVSSVTSAPSPTAGTRLLRPGNTWISSGVDQDRDLVPLLLLNVADYAVTGLSTKFRIKATVSPNNTAGGQAFTFGLYAVTPTSGATVATSIGSLVSGSAVAVDPGAFVAPSSTRAVGTDFSLTGEGYYALGVAIGGTVTSGAVAALTADLQMRHVA